MDNLLIISISTMALYFMFIIIDKIMMHISYRFNKKEFLLKYPTIKNVVKFLVGYIAIILLFILTILQNKFHFIRIPSNCDPIVLVVAIFTMYGIFISSIQFLINYSSTNTRDLYWGKSKTKLILMDSTEYKIFNSTIFRILLIYICIYSILDLAKLNFLYKYSITDYTDSFFNISIFLIMIEFIFFFIKSMAISSILFFVQEDRERINYQIKSKLLNEYKFLFNESIKFYKFDFIDIIFSELHNVDKSQREEMVYSILCHVYGWRNWDWEVHSNEVLNFIDKIFKWTKKQRIYDNVFTLKMLNENFWNQYEQSDLKFPFNILLDIYIRQENLIYNFIEKKSNSTKEMFSSIFEEVYEEKNTMLKEISCFNFPQIIWDSISSIEDIIKLSKAVRSLQIMKILYHSIESDDCCFIESLWKKIIEVYCTFIIEVLEKGKAFDSEMDDKAIEFILNINSRRKRNYNEGQLEPKDISTDYICLREKIHESLKEHLLYYLFSLENSPQNQNHILKICSFLEIKYIMAFICYRILYTGSDSSKWKGEILFFKKLISSRYYYDNVFEEQNIEFVADEIANSNISTDLIKWIFNNINAQVSENLLKECTERRYLSYAVFITFNFIFGQDIYFDRLQQNSFLNDELKIQFLNEISNIKGIMSQDYFIDVIHFVNGFPETKIELDKLMSNGKFESLLIISDYININKMLEYINLHKYIINNGVYNFLIIKLSEFDYHNLLSKLDKETQQNLVQKYERMLTASHKTIESYIDDLCVRATTLGIEIPSHKKEKVMNIFRTILK